METKNRRSIFDCVEDKAKELLKGGLSIRKVYIILKDQIPVKTGYTGFYHYVNRRNFITCDSKSFETD